jgi:putative transcriptional regulator
MTKAKKKPSRLAKALLETAADMHKSGLLDRATYDKITLRHLGPDKTSMVPSMSATQIRTCENARA